MVEARDRREPNRAALSCLECRRRKQKVSATSIDYLVDQLMLPPCSVVESGRAITVQLASFRTYVASLRLEIQVSHHPTTSRAANGPMKVMAQKRRTQTPTTTVTIS